MKNLILPLTFVFLSFMVACDRDAVFEKEQYKNIFALISESDNVLHRFHELGEESVGYVVASLGGTNPTDEDITVTLIEDPSLIDNFNLVNFNMDRSKYIQPLPKSKYDIDDYQFTIKAGEINGRLPIHIRPDGLSPDSSYFIPLRVETFTSYELNPEKNFVLYQIKTKNWWAFSDGTTVYNMRAKFKIKDSDSEINLPGTKVMHPISKNAVRVIAGNEKYESDVKVLRSSAIVLNIGDDNSVTITPFADIQVNQIDGDKDFPNIFKIEDDGFHTYKTFLLNYEYKGTDNNVYEIKEELRMLYDPDEDDDF